MARKAIIIPLDTDSFEKEDTTKRKASWLACFRDPNHIFVQIWELVVIYNTVLACLINLYMVCFNSAFRFGWLFLYQSDIMFIIHIVHHFFLAYKDERGVPVSDTRKIARRYLMSGGLIFDILSVLPLELAAVFFENDHIRSRWISILWLNRQIRFWRIIFFFNERECDIKSNTVLWKLLKYAVLCMKCYHIITCGWFVIACQAKRSPGDFVVCHSYTWAVNPYFDIAGFNGSAECPANSLLLSQYWAAATATSTGYGDISATNIKERWYSIFAMLYGRAILFGMLLGGVTSMLTNFDKKRSQFVHRFNIIKSYMKEQNVPEELQVQVIEFYEYFWSRHKGVRMERIYNNLPLALQAEISHSINKEILEKAPFFKDLGTGFLRMLSMKIRYQHCLPNQLIIVRGQIGRHMYYIHKGEIEILSVKDDKTPMTKLNAGAIFGEMALIRALPALATVQAITHCELMVLSREDMQSILDHYPAALAKIKEVATKKTAIHPKSRDDITLASSHSDGTSHLKSFGKSLKTISQHKVRPFGIDCMNEDERTAGESSTEGLQSLSENEGYLRSVWNLLRSGTIHPHGRIARIWRSYVILLTVYHLMVNPYIAAKAAAGQTVDYFNEKTGWLLLAFDYFCDIVLIIDIFVNLRMKIVTEHGTVDDIKTIRRHYVYSPGFIIDVLSITPFELLVLFCSDDKRHRTYAWYRLNRMIKFIQVNKMFALLEAGLKSNIVKVRVIKFLLYIYLMSHWIGCLFYATACYDGCHPARWYSVWVTDNYQNGTKPTTSVTYLVSLYLATSTLTGTGYGDIVVLTFSGRAAAIFAMFVGLLFYGYVISVLTATLATGDEHRVRYQEKLLAIQVFMKNRRLTDSIQKRVTAYLSLMWDKYKGTWLPGMRHLFHDAPLSLQQDIVMNEAYRHIALCPLFRDTEQAFLKALALKTMSYLFEPGEIVAYSGDISYEMYFVRRGYCLIRSPGTNFLLAELGPGKYFSEVEMLFRKPRHATLVARTFVEVLELKYSDLMCVLKDFPLIEAQFRQVMNDEAKFYQLREELFCRYPTLRYTDKDAPHLKQIAEKIERKKLMKEEEEQSFIRDPFKAKGIVSFYKASPVIKKELEEGYREMKLYGRILSMFLMKIALNPMNNIIKSFAGILLLLNLIQIITVPLHAAFFPTSIGWLLIHYFLDVLNLIHLYVRSHLAYFTQKDVVLVTHPAYTFNNYRNTKLIVDLVACLPYELIILTAGIHTFKNYLRFIPLMRFNRLLSFYRIPLVAAHHEAAVARRTDIQRAIKFFIYTILFANFITCLVFLMASPPYVGDSRPDNFDNRTGLVKNSWPYQVEVNNHINLSDIVNSPYVMYSLSLYWALATAASVGYGDINATHPWEMFLSVTMMVCGILYFSYFVASLAAALANADVQRGAFSKKLSAVKSYMEDHKVPQQFRVRIVSYYKYLYLQTKGISPKILFDALPQSLWGDLSLELYKKIIDEISLFKGTDTAFIKILCKCIQPVLYCEGEYIIRKDDISEEMYFIHKGVVDVTSENGEIIFDTMTKGEAFGEAALLFNCRRTASVRARTNCLLFILSKTDLDKALDCYPEIRRRMTNIARLRLNQARERDRMKDNMGISIPVTGRNVANNMMFYEVSSDDLKREGYEPRHGDKSINDVNVDSNQNLLEVRDLARYISTETFKDSTYPSASQLAVDVTTPRKWYTIKPDSKILGLFQKFICIQSLISTFLVVFEFSFQEHHILVTTVTHSCDVFFIVDMVVKFHVSYYTEDGDLVEEPRATVRHYLRSRKGFLRDLFAVLPLELLAFLFPHQKRLMYMSAFRLPRLIRVMNIVDFFRACEKELEINILAVRLLQNLFILSLGIHLSSSFWYAQACPPWEDGRCKEHSWIMYTRFPLNTALEKYCTCLYWCVATMTTTGYGDEHAYSTLEMQWATFVTCFGTLLFGFIMGNIASTLQSAEANRLKYEEKLYQIKKNLQYQEVPKSIQEKVMSFYQHQWTRTKGVDIEKLFEDCPKCLRAELNLNITWPMLQAIPLFADSGESFLRQICLKVTEVLFLPGDYIVKKGDVADCLFYIYRGEVEILTEDDPPRVISIMEAGQIFGEPNLLMKTSRRVTVRAKTHVDLFRLRKDDMDYVLKHYPILEKKIKKTGYARFKDILLSARDTKQNCHVVNSVSTENRLMTK